MAAPGSPAISGWSPPIVAFGTEIVTIVVGLGAKLSDAHKNLLCASSKYFESALNGGFLEGKSKEVKLFAIDPVVFEFFYRWLYSPPRGIDGPLYQQARDSELQPDLLLLNLYLLGNCLLCPGFKLLAMNNSEHCFLATIPPFPVMSSSAFYSMLITSSLYRCMSLSTSTSGSPCQKTETSGLS